MMKLATVIALLVLLNTNESSAQGSANNVNTSSNGNTGSGNPNNGNRGNDKPVGNAGKQGVPVDGGAGALLAIGITYGLQKLKKRRTALNSLFT